MDIKTHRVQRLKEFVSKANGPAALARKHEGIDASYLSQLINGHRPFGEKSARRLEGIFALPDNYFDRTEVNQDPAEYVVKKLFDQMDPKTRQKWIAIGNTLTESEEDNGDGPKTAAQ